MKQTTKFIFITAILFLQLASCKKENMCDCFKSTGTIVAEWRNISGFTRISVEDDVNVYLKQDSVFDVRVSAGKNLIGLVKTEVKDGELTITNNNKCNFVRSYEPKINVYISMPVIDYITHKGTGLIKSVNTITSSAFDVWTQSSGDAVLDVNNDKVHTHLQRNGSITVTGKTNEMTCYADHNGVLYAENLVATNYVWVYGKSTGDIHFHINSGLINITLVNEGNVYYSGNPTQIVLKEDGKGRLIKQ